LQAAKEVREQLRDLKKIARVANIALEYGRAYKHRYVVADASVFSF